MADALEKDDRGIKEIKPRNGKYGGG